MSQMILNTEHFHKNNITDEEALYMIFLYRKCNVDRAREGLIKKGYLDYRPDKLFDQLTVTEKGIQVINKIVLDSDKEIPKESNSLLEFANSLRELFPKGMQQGKYSWRGGPKEIMERLRVYYKEFDDNASKEEILEATKHYVKRMDGDPYMRTLPYFLWDKRGTPTSPLATEIAMLREGDGETGDWRNRMI